ncbi:hypothetical protein M9458_052384, partial [Cirrhinus mrigala]
MCIEGEQREKRKILPGISPETSSPLCSPVKLPDDFGSLSQYGLDLLFEAPAGEDEVSAALEGGLSLSWMTGIWATTVTPSYVRFQCPSSRKCMRSCQNRGRPLSQPERDIPTPPPSPPLKAVQRGGIRRSPRWRERLRHLAGRPRLPSKTCKFSSALVAKAYTASRQAASTLHAMPILQVYQAKVLKDLDEGVPNPELFQELRSVTDNVLRATKVTAQALGRAMSTMVVQERHLWLKLAEMWDAEKVSFLDGPISQV